MTTDRIEFTVTRRHGTKHQLSIEIDYEENSINIPASGALIGQANITTFMAAIQRAATLLALKKAEEAKENDD